MKDKSAALTTAGTGSGRDDGNTTITPGLDRERIGNSSIKKWRVVKKGATIIFDRKQHCWCLKCIDKGTFCHWNGMHVTHKPENHDHIMAKRYHEKLSNKADQSGGAGGGTSNGNNLVITQKLKEILCSKLIISDANADNICNDACGQGKD